MLNISHCCIHTLILFSVVAASNRVTAAGAGVLIFTEVDDVKYVLLADHKQPVAQRGWGILAGTVETNESILDTAIRETVEESNGAFDEIFLRNTIDISNYVHYDEFTSYFIRVKFEPANIYSFIVANDAQGVNAERGPFAWVPWTVVSKAARKAEHLGNECWDNPVPIPTEYLPEKKQTSWFFCAFLDLAIVIDKNGGLPESNKTWQRTNR